MIAPKTGGFSWDPENRPMIQEIAQDLKDFGAEGKPPSMPELFLLCAVLGWQDGYRKPVTAIGGQARETNVQYRYFSEYDFNLLAALAVADEDESDILLDPPRLLKLVEEYAAGGLALLVKARETNSNLEVWLQSELLKMVKGYSPV